MKVVGRDIMRKGGREHLNVNFGGVSAAMDVDMEMFVNACVCECTSVLI